MTKFRNSSKWYCPRNVPPSSSHLHEVYLHHLLPDKYFDEELKLGGIGRARYRGITQVLSFPERYVLLVCTSPSYSQVD